MIKRALVSGFGSVLLASCLSVPISTLWDLRDMSPAGFAKLDPAEMRLAVLSESDARFTPGKSSLLIKVSRKNRMVSRHLLCFAPDGSPIASQQNLPAAGEGESWAVMKLTEDGVVQLRKLQAETRDLPDDDDTTLFVKINVGGIELPQSLKIVHVEAWIRFTTKRGYVKLLKRHSIAAAQIADDPHNSTEDDGC